MRTNLAQSVNSYAPIEKTMMPQSDVNQCPGDIRNQIQRRNPSNGFNLY